MESEPGKASKQLLCTCQRHCAGKPRLLAEATFYRHFAEADNDEKPKLKITKFSTLDSARIVLANRLRSSSNRMQLESPPQQPEVGTFTGTRRAEKLRALVKRARAGSEPQHRAGKRKCAHNKENIDPLDSDVSTIQPRFLLLYS